MHEVEDRSGAIRELAGTRRGVLQAIGAGLALGAAPALAQPVPSPDRDAPDAPAVRISNGIASAVLLMPDAARGYYRATRFDWSGAIADLQVGGHSYFGRWFAKYDPRTHDAIMGPVQEYVTGQGFDAAAVGGPFVKIGVGVLRKPAEPIRGFPTLEIIDGGKWATRVRPNAIDFTHEVSDPVSGYGYRYSKTVALTPGKPQLTLTQRIEATGAHPIDTEMYDHNFFVLDGQPSGPDIEVRFPFTLEPFNVRGDAVAVTENRLNYLRPIDTPVRMQLKGFGPSASDYDIRVENRKTRAGVRVTADRPLSDLVFWTSPRTTCPEAYIHVHAERGRPMEWKIVYDFYELPARRQG
ncbi:hypothetical protein [Sphingomonas quercus]|uniref:DUF3108 domain-containing protein n=1 Tax=Sphingomonas quercus TaxID=2842451 RepID=A0ABS6BIV0_9SPHN|nr:hypothetical protein [Sphingomonas quercus]MBU3077361.1 hypothetical protein [Sphingomonas quercus]